MRVVSFFACVASALVFAACSGAESPEAAATDQSSVAPDSTQRVPVPMPDLSQRLPVPAPDLSQRVPVPAPQSSQRLPVPAPDTTTRHPEG